MGKNINVNLQFTANTQQAKAQMAALQQQLASLSNSAHLGQNLSGDIAKIKTDLLGVQVALNNATNIDTGKLNFTKFSQELQQSKISANDLANSFIAMGNQGAQALLGLTQAVAMSEMRLFSFSGQLKKLGVTFANTIRWQITSSITTGLMSAFSGVIDYAEDLNESLTQIQVVTGKNTETMSKFATEAQKAAKALSSSTLDYTEGALIYYQQGLNDQEVKERTETTIKLANVVGENAETVSEWMTSIWNNFDDGSKSLEYYADVLAKLGAATASSADEIAGGLEKFSAVADTVGLSYEYAAAAVTTITAATRQSEDVVGTSLKTIFARMEDLQLGNELDDGTTLGTYSSALAAAGVAIKDANGNLREMDDIIDDTMARWDSLGRSQQVALAQSVAGIRQYSQFMALMDNSDAFKQNVEWARDSTGELEKQNTFFENSVEGAKQRIENDLEELKNSILQDDALKSILNGVDSLLVYINKLMDSLGGMPTILTTIAAIALRLYGPEAMARLQGMISNLGALVAKTAGVDVVGQKKANFISTMSETAGKVSGQGEFSKAFGEVSGNQFSRTQWMEENEKWLSASYKEILSLSSQLIQQQEEEVLNEAKKVDELKKEVDLKKQTLTDKDSTAANRLAVLQSKGTLNNSAGNIFFQESINGLSRSRYEDSTSAYGQFVVDARKKQNGSSLSVEELNKLDSLYKQIEVDQKAYVKSGAANVQNTKSLTREQVKLRSNLEKSRKDFRQYVESLNDQHTQLDALKRQYPQLSSQIDDVIKAQTELEKSQGSSTQAQEKYNKALAALKEEQKRAIANSTSWTSVIVSSLSGLASMSSGVMMLKNSFDSLTTSIADGSFTFGDFLSTFTTILMSLPMLITGVSQFGQAIDTLKTKTAVATAATEADTAAEIINQGAKETSMVVDDAETNNTIKNNEKEDASNKKSILFNLANWFAKNPILGAIVAASVLAVIAGIGAISVSAKKTANLEAATRESEEEDYSKKKESYSSNKEASQDFFASYTEYQYSGEGEEELKDSMLSVAETYDSLALKNAAYLGDYETFISELRELQLEELDTYKKSIEKMQSYNDSDIIEQSVKGKGHASGDEYIAEFNNGVSSDSSEDDVLYSALEDEEVQKILESVDGVKLVKNNGGDVRLEIDDKNDAEAIKAGYRALEKVTEIVRSDGGDSTTQLYKEIMSKLSDMSEYLDKDEEYTSEILENDISTAIINTKANGKSIEDLDTSYEYAEFYKNISEQIETWDKDAINLYNSLISSYSNVADWNNRLIAIENENHDFNDKISKNWYSEQILGADTATANAIARVEVTPTMNEEEFWKLVEDFKEDAQESIAQGYAEAAGKTSSDLKTYTKILKDNNSALAAHGDILNIVAGESIRLNDKLETLTDTFNDNSKALLEGKTNSTEYAYAVEAIANDLATFLNTDTDLSLFVRKNKELVTEFLNGNYYLFDTLQIKAAQYTASTLGDVDKLSFAFSSIKGIEAGEIIDNESFLEKLNQLIEDSEFTIGQLEEIFTTAGFEVSIKNNTISELTKKSDRSYLSKTLEEEQKKNQQDLKDSKKRYHEIKEVLSDIESELDLISDAKDRAFGAQRLAYLDQEIAKQQQLNAAQEEYLRQAQEYYQQDRAALLNSGWGVQLDDAGRITNFTQIQEGITDKDSLSDFQKLVDDYEESLNLIEEQQQKIKEGQYELHDLALEKIEYQIEFKIDVDEFTLDSLEHQLSRIEDKAFAAAEKIALIGKSLEKVASQANTYTSGIESILGNVYSSSQVSQIMSGNLSGIDITQLTEEDLEQIKEYGSSLTELEETMRDQHTQVHEALTDSIEEWNEEFDRNMSKFDQYNSIVENYKNIIDLVGKDNLGISDDILRKMYATQKSIANDQLSAAKDRKEAAENAYAQIEAQYNNAVALYGADSEIALAWKQQMLDAEDTLTDATDSFQEAWQNALQAAADAFSASVELIIENFESAVSGIYGTLEALQEQFDQQSEISDRYLENYEKTYEINKLNRKITQDIAKTTSAKSQKELRDLQAQLLAMSEDGVEVSQRDVEFMQKKYDLLLAEQALRDAQNAKSVVRLKRDSEGNYGYVYTADQTAVNEAQQAYEDAAYNLEKWNEETLTTISEQIITIKQAFAQAIQAIAEDTSLSDEERKAKMAETTAYYVGQLDYWTSEAERLNYNISEANSQFHMDMADSIHDTLIGQLFPDLDSWTDLYDQDTQAMQEMSENLGKEIDDLADSIEDAMREAGFDIDDFKDVVEEDLGKAQTAASNTANAVEGMKNDITEDLNTTLGKVSSFETSWSTSMKNIAKSVDTVTTAIKAMLEEASKASNITIEDTSYTLSDQSANTDLTDDQTGEDPDKEEVSNSKYYYTDGKTTKAAANAGYVRLVDSSGNYAGYYKTSSAGTLNSLPPGQSVMVSDKENIYKYLVYKNGTLNTSWNKGIYYKSYTEAAAEKDFYATDSNYKKLITGSANALASEDDFKKKVSHVYVGSKAYYYLGKTNSGDGTMFYPYDSIESGTNDSGFNWYPKVATGTKGVLMKYNTGGYTGEWGPEGKLAVLHQKEIVLNKDETQDFLAAINLLREMQVSAPTTQIASPSIAPRADTIQQEVHITAEFPNATNHSEIEEAFKNLANYTTQYVNRKS